MFAHLVYKLFVWFNNVSNIFFVKDFVVIIISLLFVTIDTISLLG